MTAGQTASDTEILFSKQSFQSSIIPKCLDTIITSASVFQFLYMGRLASTILQYEQKQKQNQSITVHPFG